MQAAAKPLALIVVGPTASGKSALALALGERLGGTIINADSMQVYRDLRILTARPSDADEDRLPHLLYGVRAAEEGGSAAWWREEALRAMALSHDRGRLPILTGGTGLYLDALVHGIAEVPAPPPGAREEARRRLAEHGSAALHAALAKVDPATAHRLHPSDSQRIARAWEVWCGTGRGLAAWQNRRGPAAPWRFAVIRLDPPRDTLRAAIAARFDAMLRDGAIEEVRALVARDLDPALPVMRAHGVPELSAYLRGQLGLAEARTRIELVTGQYTKRQATWFRHHPLVEPYQQRIIQSRWDQCTQDSQRILADLDYLLADRVDASPLRD